MLVKKLFKRISCILATVAVLAVTAPNPGAADEKPIVLKGLTPWTMSYYWSEPFAMFQKMVNKRLKGKVLVTYLGSNEVVPTFEQFEALRNGVIDVALVAASYYTGQVPEASALLYTNVSPTELRKNGYYDLMRKVHLEKGNVIYLANVSGGVGKAFRMFTSKKVDKPDFSGLKFRVTPVYVELVKTLGGTPIVMPPSEVYTALERGVVDGYGWSYGGITDFGWEEVTKYVIDYPFYTANISICVNADVWNKLPQDVRDGLEEVAAELEAKAEKWMDDYIAKEDILLKGLGVKFIKFSPADGERFVRTAYEEGWKAYTAKHPDFAAKIRPLSGE
jgi:TRAP-type C4-dicarboxylate transport system substrate-binding protein